MSQAQTISRRIELDLSLDQVLSIVRQLKPRDQEVVWRAIAPPAEDQRLEALLSRVLARVERYPITEEEIDAEVELARQEIYAQKR